MRITADFRLVFLCSVLISAALLPLSAHSSDYPLIERAHHSDPLYRQHQESIREFHMRRSADQELPPLQLYRYAADPGATLIELAARFSLSYSTLATVNRLPQNEIPPDTEYLLIPSQPGIFVAEVPHSDLEQLIHELRVSGERSDHDYTELVLQTANGTERFWFYAAQDFDRVERLAFLNILFRRPVRNIRISSHYGYRISPLTNRRAFHAGVDFAAPRGTAVHASREGQVEAIGYHPIYGNFVLLSHSNGFQTFYGHLDQIDVRLNDSVSSGMIVGTVGSSGLSTGPHLHFEIRLNGETRDPARHMPGLRR